VKVSDLVGPRLIDLNVDIGEGFPNDVALLQVATSANVCCGVHAGDEKLTAEAVARCRQYGVRIGAHPGYPDRNSMGRAPMGSSQVREYLSSLFSQVEWFVNSFGAAYLKPHGAFYNETAMVLPEDWESKLRRQPLATRYENGGLFLAEHPGMQSLMMMLRINKLTLMGLEATAHKTLAERAGQKLIREGFADRAYQPDGTLVPRSQPGAVLTNTADVRSQVAFLAPRVDSICLHGDGENCVEFAHLVKEELISLGYGVGVES